MEWHMPTFMVVNVSVSCYPVSLFCLQALYCYCKYTVGSVQTVLRALEPWVATGGIVRLHQLILYDIKLGMNTRALFDPSDLSHT